MTWKNFKEEKPEKAKDGEYSDFIVIRSNGDISLSTYWSGNNLEKPGSVWHKATWYISHRDLIKTLPDFDKKMCLNYRCDKNCHSYCSGDVCKVCCQFAENLPIAQDIAKLNGYIRFLKEYLSWLNPKRTKTRYDPTPSEWINTLKRVNVGLLKIGGGS